jgi:hypothetical protein
MKTTCHLFFPDLSCIFLLAESLPILCYSTIWESLRMSFPQKSCYKQITKFILYFTSSRWCRTHWTKLLILGAWRRSAWKCKQRRLSFSSVTYCTLVLLIMQVECKMRKDKYFRKNIIFAWGTCVFNRKDVRLPVQLQRAMAAEAEAAREARAKVNTVLSRLHWFLNWHKIFNFSLQEAISYILSCFGQRRFLR